MRCASRDRLWLWAEREESGAWLILSIPALAPSEMLAAIVGCWDAALRSLVSGSGMAIGRLFASAVVGTALAGEAGMSPRSSRCLIRVIATFGSILSPSWVVASRNAWAISADVARDCCSEPMRTVMSVLEAITSGVAGPTRSWVSCR